MRIGVNHGSLSDRIMSRYGDTPAGMVESAMEFLRVFVAENYLKVVISIKASNTVVMVATVRLLVEAMEKENMHFPLHLGVTEAGDGEDGRIKSAVGIGTLLVEGIGDTIRVSLSEDPECEVPVAEFLANYVENFGNLEPAPVALDGVSGKKCRLVGNKPIVVARKSDGMTSHPDFVLSTDGTLDEEITTIVPYDLWKPGNGSQPLFTVENYAYAAGCNAPTKWLQVDAESFSPDMRISSDTAIILSVPAKYNRPAMMQSVMSNLLARGNDAPVVLHCDYSAASDMEVQVMASVDMGSCLMNCFGAGIMLDAPIDADKLVAWCFGILQAARLRTTKTEYISCPSCGRTLFDLQTTVKRVKEATSHLTHLKIGIMGCIVNGPGEMADADYGYVGAAAGKISLYKGKQCIERNIPQEEAIPHLIALIKANNDWIEP